MSERDKNIELLKKYLKKDYMIKHSIAVEAVMEAIALRFNKDVNLYATAGLMHDIDYEMTQNAPENHAIVGAKILRENGFAEEVCKIVQAHRKSRIDDIESFDEAAIVCSDAISGLVVASALIHPDKKLSSIDAEFICRRFYEKGFAKGANREKILICKYLPLELEQFAELAHSGMLKHSEELGL
ncbi:metal dependent phosphohydrolase [Thermodesulfobium narugense DSM 14796]|uniref:Metal dependent phosphohydrolase n=1 Tax=Thermodesulfobium narugense DSM 14796 TaxID=747365 RepID=M1E541_9BACT|nr:HDIG domain-containing metalloprotein [Thermodesulfobium narugense]AEE14001.1 metal dependent phosphohydrolase [Thermodesulfobium narugense DSM 14796]